jgi:hypothetical protein
MVAMLFWISVAVAAAELGPGALLQYNGTEDLACPCSAGRFCPENDIVAYACPEQHYQDAQGRPNCKQCSSGQYQDLRSQTSCKSCRENAAAAEWSKPENIDDCVCKQNFWAITSSDTCEPCARDNVCFPSHTEKLTVCAPGYHGTRCMNCIQGAYYKKIDGECRKCPSIGASEILLLLFVIALGYQVVASGVLQKVINIREIVADIQITAALSIPTVPWPPIVYKCFNYFQAFSMDIGGMSSQSGCTTGGSSSGNYKLLWWTMVLAPFVLSLGPVALQHIKLRMYNKKRKRVQEGKLSAKQKNIMLQDHAAKTRWSVISAEKQVVSIFFIIQTVCKRFPFFFPLFGLILFPFSLKSVLKKCLETFVCVNIDGLEHPVLSQAQDVQCVGGGYIAMQAFAVLGIVLYGIVAILYCGYMINSPLARLLQRSYFSDTHQQLVYMRLEHCYGFLYHDYKPFDWHIICGDARRATRTIYHPAGSIVPRSSGRGNKARHMAGALYGSKSYKIPPKNAAPEAYSTEVQKGGMRRRFRFAVGNKVEPLPDTLPVEIHSTLSAPNPPQLRNEHQGFFGTLMEKEQQLWKWYNKKFLPACAHNYVSGFKRSLLLLFVLTSCMSRICGIS